MEEILRRYVQLIAANINSQFFVAIINIFPIIQTLVFFFLLQMKRLSSEGTCLTVDWIGKTLYWAEVNKKESYSNIMGVDLTYDSEPKHILNHSSVITSLEVEPFSGYELQYF